MEPVKSQTSYGEQVYRLPLTSGDKHLLINRYWCHHVQLGRPCLRNMLVR